ncbi:MAG: long-chain fatty acid--CoA ligase [Reichenbachiella sp.]
MELQRTFDSLYYQLEHYPNEACMAKKVDGVWRKYSTSEVADIVKSLAQGLLSIGVVAGDRVAIISPNRPEWNFVDLACAEIGVISVPMYPTITTDDFGFIFKHAGVKIVFGSDKDLIKKIKKASKIFAPEKIYSFDEVSGASHWEELLTIDSSAYSQQRLDSMKAVRPEDLFTIIYTSGTTGDPKGVMLSHHNVVSNFMAVHHAVGHLFNPDDRALSFLPLCHILERTASHFYLRTGISIYYATSLETIGEEIKDVKPQMFTSVPRLLEKIYDKIVAKGLALGGVKKRLFFWALNLGLKFDPEQDQGWWYNQQLSIARKLVFSKWVEALGGNLKYVIVGAAALQHRLARVFWAAQIPVCEGYGLTETSPGICFNLPFEGHIRIGSVGKLLQDIEVKIAEDGEILCKGPNVMMGYYNQPDLTASVMTDGWFHTGDIGQFDDDFLKITDRKKEMFKTSGGKYIAPQVMENKFKESVYIEQIIVLGEGRKFPSALIVPHMEMLTDWCRRHQVDIDLEKMTKSPEVIKLLEKEIKKKNKGFGNWEQVKKFEILDHEWSVDTEELTPTLKLKRRVIKEKYAAQIERLYDDA